MIYETEHKKCFSQGKGQNPVAECVYIMYQL